MIYDCVYCVKIGYGACVRTIENMYDIPKYVYHKYMRKVCVLRIARQKTHSLAHARMLWVEMIKTTARTMMIREHKKN